MKIPQEKARVLAECALGSNGPRQYLGLPLDVIENRDYEEHRWTMTMELVVRDDEGKMYRAFYDRGLTEHQCEEPFEYDGDEIEFHEVEKVPVTAYEYRKVKA